MKEYFAKGLAGCVTQRRSRITGHLVGLYHADQADLDSSGGPWATICEEHGHVVNHPTLAHARSHLGDPTGWCEVCNGSEPPPDRQVCADDDGQDDSKRDARVLRTRAAGPDHQVVTIARSGDRPYMRTPCAQCPWRRENVGSFPPEAFKHSAETAYDMSQHVFACHVSGAEALHTCAGFLLRGAENNLAIRLARFRGDITDDVSDNGAQLHESYRAMAIANGVDPDDPVLQQCRP